MKTNPHPVEVNPLIPRNHEGFKDSLGKPLAPGDEIIVKGYNSVFHAVITRFTPKRIYWKVMYLDESMPNYWFDYECCTQLHYWYSNGNTHHANPAYHTVAEDRRKLRGVMKLEDPHA